LQERFAQSAALGRRERAGEDLPMADRIVGPRAGRRLRAHASAAELVPPLFPVPGSQRLAEPRFGRGQQIVGQAVEIELDPLQVLRNELNENVYGGRLLGTALTVAKIDSRLHGCKFLVVRVATLRWPHSWQISLHTETEPSAV